MKHSTKRPRPAWFAVPVDAWPDIAAALPTPWPRGAILADLAYWQDLVWTSDGRERRPYRRELVERWGVSDYEARRLMRSVELWADPRKTRPAPVFNHRSTTVQPRFNHESSSRAYRYTYTDTDTQGRARAARCSRGMDRGGRPVARPRAEDGERQADPAATEAGEGGGQGASRSTACRRFGRCPARHPVGA